MMKALQMSLFRSHPLVSALLGSVLTLGGLVAFDWYRSPRLFVPSIDAAQVPRIDGDISDAAWARATPVTVLTRHGGDFGGTGETRIVVRAVHDRRYVYMALEWDDPTRSLEYMPLVKEDGGWHRLRTDFGNANERRYYDDRIAIMLSQPGVALIGGAIHLAKKPLSDGPASTTGRGLHYTAPGKFVDLWQWHAAVGGLTDRVDDGFVGPPRPPTPAQMAGTERYLGGIGEDDPGHPVAAQNFTSGPEADNGTVTPIRLPETGAADLDEIWGDTGHSAPPEQAGLWVISAATSKPYVEGGDAAFNDDAVIPGIMVDDTATPGPDDVIARGAWAGGHWVLELRRSLQGGEKDVAFRSGTMIWFAAFDHSQSRHTYHLRPLIVEMQ